MIRHDEEFLRAIERLAVVLDEAGMPRMAGRVYAYMLVDGRGPYSASELGDALRVSAAAVSGALGRLVGRRFLRKERAPGDRVDRYQLLLTDVGSVLASLRADQLLTWAASLGEAAQILGTRTRGARRMHEAAHFVATRREKLLGSVQMRPQGS